MGNTEARMKDNAAVLSNVTFFRGLNADALHLLADSFTSWHYDAGKFITEEGDDSRDFYVVARGSVEILAPSSMSVGRERIVLCVKRQYEFFGEASLIREGYVRDIDIRSREPCTLLVLSKQQFDRYPKPAHFNQLNAMLRSYAQQKVLTMLKKVPFFSGFSPVQLRLLLNLFQIEQYNRARIICRQGEAGNSLYLILQGSVQVVAEGTSSQQAGVRCEGFLEKKRKKLPTTRQRYVVLRNDHLSIYEAHMSEEVVSHILPAPAASSPESKTPDRSPPPRSRSRTTTVPASAGRRVSVVGGFTYTGSRIFKHRYRVTGVAAWNRSHGIQVNVESEPPLFFIAASEEDRDEWIRSLRAGIEAVDPSKPAQKRLSLRSEAAEDEDRRNRGLLVTEMSSGSFFGEISLVTDMPRTATVTALETVVALALTKENFQSFLNLVPDMRLEIERQARHRSAQNLQALKLPFLAGLNEANLNLLTTASKLVHAEPGQHIFRQGDLGDSFYIILHGDVKITMSRSSGTESASEGDGSDTDDTAEPEASLAASGAGGPACPTSPAMTASPSPKSTPPSSPSLASAVAARSSAAARPSSLVLPRTALPRPLVKSTSVLSAPGGIGRSSPSHASSTEVVVNTLSTGDYFGEIALLTDHPRLATVTATSPTTLLELDKQSFMAVFAGESSESLADFELKLFRHNAELSHVIRHPIGIKYFTLALKKEFSAENIEFWTAAEEFHDAYSASGNSATPSLDMLMAARTIYLNYIDDSSSQQINIRSDVRNEIETALTASEVTPDLFCAAQAEIYTLMEKDNFSRFKKSNLFEQLLQEIDPYKVSDVASAAVDGAVDVARKRSSARDAHRRSVVPMTAGVSPVSETSGPQGLTPRRSVASIPLHQLPGAATRGSPVGLGGGRPSSPSSPLGPHPSPSLLPSSPSSGANGTPDTPPPTGGSSSPAPKGEESMAASSPAPLAPLQAADPAPTPPAEIAPPAPSPPKSTASPSSATSPVSTTSPTARRARTSMTPGHRRLSSLPPPKPPKRLSNASQPSPKGSPPSLPAMLEAVDEPDTDNVGSPTDTAPAKAAGAPTTTAGANTSTPVQEPARPAPSSQPSKPSGSPKQDAPSSTPATTSPKPSGRRVTPSRRPTEPPPKPPRRVSGTEAKSGSIASVSALLKPAVPKPAAPKPAAPKPAAPKPAAPMPAAPLPAAPKPAVLKTSVPQPAPPKPSTPASEETTLPPARADEEAAAGAEAEEPAPAEAEQTDPAPGEAEEAALAPANAEEADPAPAEADETDGAPAEGDETAIPPVEEEQTEPAPAEAAETEPAPAEAAETEPAQETNAEILHTAPSAPAPASTDDSPIPTPSPARSRKCSTIEPPPPPF